MVTIKSNKSENITTDCNSLPIYYGYCFVIWAIILLFFTIFSFSNFAIYGKFTFLILALIGCSYVTIKLFRKRFNAKNHVEKFTKTLLIIATTAGIVITLLITVSVLFEALRFFKMVGASQFFFGLKWNPQIPVYEGQGMGDSSFGMIPVFLGTLLITFIAISIAVPLGILSAIYLVEYANARTRNILKPILEILAGVPTVVYGYFAVVTVAPMLKSAFAFFGITIASESALTAGFVMGVMIIPFILSLSDDSIHAVPRALKDGALALGSTKSEMVKKVILLAALPGITSSVLLAISRAIGETMIVTMAAGLVAKLTFNPLDSVTTATAQIVTLLVGDQEADSPKTLAAFALGLVLFIMTLCFNIVALYVSKKYKEKYE
ncbi:MAG: phosphate ABC transporter permease subunit PstC [Proteobacteria bacterium]|nr:phosphate ABC transporter permease subunit PstC [Pseudomonadota bacterium]